MYMTKEFITAEDKRLVYEDINAKLAFRTVKVTDGYDTFDVEAVYWNKKGKSNSMNFQILCNGEWIHYDFQNYKICLRPLMSMSDVEKDELISDVFGDSVEAANFNFDLEFNGIAITEKRKMNFVGSDVIINLINYLDSHNFDVRCLIEKELALEDE